jgi:hypothetical protein
MWGRGPALYKQKLLILFNCLLLQSQRSYLLQSRGHTGLLGSGSSSLATAFLHIHKKTDEPGSPRI